MSLFTVCLPAVFLACYAAVTWWFNREINESVRLSPLFGLYQCLNYGQRWPSRQLPSSAIAVTQSRNNLTVILTIRRRKAKKNRRCYCRCRCSCRGGCSRGKHHDHEHQHNEDEIHTLRIALTPFTTQPWRGHVCGNARGLAQWLVSNTRASGLDLAALSTSTTSSVVYCRHKSLRLGHCFEPAHLL